MRGPDPSAELMALAPFPRERTWLLPAPRAAQEARDHLSEAALAQVAAHLHIPLSEVRGVATGYPELRLAPRGHHHARVCTGVSCALLGGGELLAEAARRHGVAVVDAGAEGAFVVEIVTTLLQFNAQESCGKCTPCRDGTPRLLALVEAMERDAAADGHTARARELAETIQLASLCGLGQAAPLALLRALETFPDDIAGRS